MADPNQTPTRGDWACPCSGCKKAVAWERKQLINQIKEMNRISEVIDLIQERIDKKI